MAIGTAVLLTLVLNAGVVVARTGGGGTSTVEAGAVRSASLTAGRLQPGAATTTTGAPVGTTTSAPVARGGQGTTTSPPKTSTTTAARPAITTSTTVMGAAGGVEGPGVYVVTPDGTGVRRLAGGYGFFSWSPDGSKLAYGDGNVLQILNADGSGRSELAPGVGATVPAWSPDGSRIAFGRSGSIYVIRPDGVGGATLIEPQGQLAGWTPDSRLVVITWDQAGFSSVVVHDKDGTRRVIASDASNTVPPAPSRDGRLVAYLGNGISVARVDGSGSRALTRLCCGSESVRSPLAWSPDSRQVAYIDYGNVRVVGADGAGDRILVPKATSPAWSSDGRLAVIDEQTTRADGLLHLTLQVIGAGRERRMVFDAGQKLSVQSPKWSPNGRLIAVSVTLGPPAGGSSPASPAGSIVRRSGGFGGPAMKGSE